MDIILEWASTLPSAPPQRKEVLFCPLPREVRHLKLWLTKYFVANVDIFHMYEEMVNDECTEMPLKFQDSRNPSVFVTTPEVGVTVLNLTAANHVVITPNFRGLNEQRQAFAQVIRLRQQRVPHARLLNMEPGVYDNHMRDLHQHSGVAQIRVQHGLMSRLNTTTTMLYRIWESCEDHTMRLPETGDTLQSDEPSS